jgi:gliding motility-associated lipoprotein GldH
VTKSKFPSSALRKPGTFLHKIQRGFGFVPALIVLILLTTASCDQENALFDRFISIHKDGWAQDSIIEIEVLIEDTDLSYTGFTGIRHNPNYPYRNFYIFREVVSERGVEYRDTIMFVLSDQQGRRLGTGMGHTREIIAPLGQAPFKFGKKGIYTFRFSQAMRPEVIQGIEDVYFRLTPVKKED